MDNRDTAHQLQQNNKVDILIVGAGLSGLTSAFKIMQKEPSLHLRILEKSNRIGGQLTRVALGEIGAKWINEGQGHIYHLLNALSVRTVKRHNVASQLKTYSELDDGIFSKLAKYELKRYINELESKQDLYKSVYVQHNADSMYRHIQKRLFFNASRKYMLNLVLLVCGADAKSVQFKDFMSICYACGGIKALVNLAIETHNCNLIEFPSNDLLHKLLHNVENIEIVCRRQVIEINQYRDFVEVRDSANEYHTADAIILAIPFNRTQHIRFWPPIPPALQHCLPQHSDNHVITSFLISYTVSYWREKGFSGHFSKLEPLLIAHEYRPTVYSGFLVHEQGIEPLVKSIVTHEFAKIFGEEMLSPQEFQQHSYELNNLAHSPLTTPWNRIIWSSSAAAATCYRGYLGGAVQSGLRAAMNALLLSRPQLVTWQDVVEIQCHNHHQKRASTWTSTFLSSCNLYNVSSYTLFICGLVIILTKAYKTHH